MHLDDALRTRAAYLREQGEAHRAAMLEVQARTIQLLYTKPTDGGNTLRETLEQLAQEVTKAARTV